jgi:hypothetical protein
MDTSPTAPLLRRVVLSGLLGVAATALAPFPVVAAAFGAVVSGGLIASVLLVVLIGCLAVVHRASGGSASHVAWGTGVAVGSIGLALLVAFAWQASGRPFGPSMALWALAGGAGTALVAAAGTRRTAVPAGLVVALLCGWAVLTIDPRLPSSTGSRGCIAQSAEQAARECP